MREQYRLWLAQRYVPIMGGDDDDDNDSGGDQKDDDTTDDNADDKDDDDSNTDSTDDDDDGDSDGTTALATLTKKVKELEIKLSKSDAAVVRAKKEAADAKAEHAEKTGDWKRLASERETQLKDANDDLGKLTEERDSAVKDLESFQKQVRVVRIAQKLGFKDPEDAQAQLESQERKLRAAGEEPDLMGDDATTERTLRKLGEDKKYLVDQKRRTGGPMNGNRESGSLSMEQVKAMSTEEVISRKKEVDAFLASQGSTG
jgi:hypothetical protein